ncbi:MAG: CAP domain-containing protein [Bacteroidota bacterium]
MRTIFLIWICGTLAAPLAAQWLPADEYEYEYAATDWLVDSLDTARDADYMRPEEREMIYEMNRLRSDPQRYIQYLIPYLQEARYDLKTQGKGTMHYSLTTVRWTDAQGNSTVRVDTNWHDRFEEAVRAVESLIETLEVMDPLPILRPDPGIYAAARHHADDQNQHGWRLGHRGSDGSGPNDRITRFAPNMRCGNENIGGKGLGHPDKKPTPRTVVIGLLIDTGIPGYGHRRNTLNPNWTHFAPCYGGYAREMHMWLQEYGRAK